jgi:hypothetical protein
MPNLIVADATRIDADRLRLYDELKQKTAVAREKYARTATQVNEVVNRYFDEFPDEHARVKHLRREIRLATKGVLSDVTSDDSYTTTGGTEQLYSAQKHLISRAYKFVANLVHPDKPKGDINLFHQVQRAYEHGDLTFLTELYIRLEHEPDPRWRQYEGIEFWRRELERPNVSLKILQTSPEFTIVRHHAAGQVDKAKKLAGIRLNELAYSLWMELNSIICPDQSPPRRKTLAEPTQELGALAPSDFEPHFVLVEYRTESDGLFAGDFAAERHSSFKFKGHREDKEKVRDMLTYDVKTAIGIATRLSARTFKTDPTKRLDPNTTYIILIRVGKKAATGELTAVVKSVGHVVNGVEFDLDKDAPQARLIRSVGRFLPEAFKEVQTPPDFVQKSELVDE